MLYTLTFTKTENDQRTPYVDEQGSAVMLQIEADSRTGAIFHADTVQFCETNICTVRRVIP